MHPPADQEGPADSGSPPHMPYDPREPYEPRGRRRRGGGRNNSLGIFVLALIIGSMMGGTCVTCATLSERDAETYFARGDRVGVVEVTGAIVESKETVRAIRKFAEREDIAALVLRIESPGGGVAPSQSIYRALREASKIKPVVASMGSMAASGGFWISLGTDWVFAEAGTLTGSIGVIFQGPDLQGIAEALRFKMRTYKSGPLKDLGNPFRAVTPADEAQFQAIIDDIYDQFVTLTAERRGQSKDQVRKVADGRVMTGRAALKADLIDELGGLYVAAKKAVLLARARTTEGVQTSSAAYDDVEGPILVYPPEPTPNLAELFGVTLQRAVQTGVSQGVHETLKSADEAGFELR